MAIVESAIEVKFPNLDALAGSTPTVVIGPNGSGKTRQTRETRWFFADGETDHPHMQVPEFINAARAISVQQMGPTTVSSAEGDFNQQKQNAVGNYMHPVNDVHAMLLLLAAEHSEAANAFMRACEDDPEAKLQPPQTRLRRLERIWADIFPGRKLSLNDWNPTVTNQSGPGAHVEYSALTMSDGEKVALYLAGRVITAHPGAIVIDEPETHLHTQLAVRLWDVLERERRDLAFVYVTHDLAFALSRRDPTFLVSDPVAGLKPIDVPEDLPQMVAEALLGSASLSFYASRVVFCEGDATSYDIALYSAWFDGPDTVVRAVGGCEIVMRCVQALTDGNLATALHPLGIIDRDFHPDSFLGALPAGVHAHGFHEVESLMALPAVVSAVCEHMGSSLDSAAYAAKLRSTINTKQVDAVIMDRWKRRLEPQLEALVAPVKKNFADVQALEAGIPNLFDPQHWSFDAALILSEERDRVKAGIKASDHELLELFPGKQMLPEAAKQAGVAIPAYVQLITSALRSSDTAPGSLRSKIETALASYLPARYAAAAVPTSPL